MIPSVYKYLDYRQYFTDVLKEKKKIIRSFSYRNFSRLAGSSSPNFLQLITANKLNISDTQVATLAKSLSLRELETKYLKNIVDFDHAKTYQLKDKYFQRIILSREYNSIKIIEKNQYDYFSKWYNPVVRELVSSEKYTGDPEWIADRIAPRVTLGRIKKSIALLVSLGLIKKDENGSYVRTHNTISSPSEIASMGAFKYHQDIISIAKESIDRFESSQRDIRSVTIGLDQNGFGLLKQRMEAFWKELLAFADTQKSTGKVMQVNMQLFPLSTKARKKS